MDSGNREREGVRQDFGMRGRSPLFRRLRTGDRRLGCLRDANFERSSSLLSEPQVIHDAVNLSGVSDECFLSRRSLAKEDNFHSKTFFMSLAQLAEGFTSCSGSAGQVVSKSDCLNL